MSVPDSTGPAVDWTALRRAAHEATRHSFAPYSDVHVGAAGLLANGDVVTGCNVENASYGLSFCAEVTLVGRLRMRADGMTNPGFIAVVATDGRGTPMAPCGRCRQVLIEHGGPDMLVLLRDGPHRLGDLLPGAFTTVDLGPSAGTGPFVEDY